MAVSDLSVADVTDTGRPLHVAMVAPPYFSVPPSGYGGIESVVAGLVDGLVERGHRVTLLAAGRHGTRAQQFLSTSDAHPADRLGEALPEVVNAARVGGLIGTGSAFDLVHDHTLAGPLLATGRSVPTVVTVHGPLSDLADVYRPGRHAAGLVAISHDQRRAAPDLNWLATVHNGIDVSTYPYSARKGDYCLFLGRFHPDKAPHLAIDAARAAGRRILLAGKCSETVEQRYYDAEVAPRLGPDAVNVGVADHDTKRELLAGARCLVFPSCWAEPFGMVLVEAMAFGTPVVALANGAVPEVVDHAMTGLVVRDPEGLADGIRGVSIIDPAECRRQVASRFSIEAMAACYEQAYRRATRRVTTRPFSVSERTPALADAAGQSLRDSIATTSARSSASSSPAETSTP
jgi:glycosyltransferase involved in cell wall biosynthesis